MNEIGRVHFETSADLCENHVQLQTKTNETLKRIFDKSSLLRDIECDVTPEELKQQIAIAKGASIVVYVKREPFAKIKAIVPAVGSTLATLKKAIKWQFTLQQRRELNRRRSNGNVSVASTSSATKKTEDRARDKQSKSIASSTTTTTTVPKISWKYIWRTYSLEHNGEVLIDDQRPITDWSIRNKSVLKFVKKRRTKKGKTKFTKETNKERKVRA